MKFSFDDLQHVQKLRISIPPSASPQAIELANQFNAELDQIQKRLDEFFSLPDFEPLSLDLKDVEKIGKERRGRKFDIVKDLVKLLALRVSVDTGIQGHLLDASTEARKTLAATQATAETRLAAAGLSGADLKHAVGRADDVKAANDAWERTKTHAAVLNNGENLPTASVGRIRNGFLQRFNSWISDLAEFESAPQNPEQPQMPVWRSHEPQASAK